MHVTPQQVFRISVRAVAVALPTAIIIMLLWAFRVLPDHRPVLVLMVYLLALAVCVVAGVAAATSACHMAIGNAFSAGLRAGSGVPTPVVPRPGRLRAVE